MRLLPVLLMSLTMAVAVTADGVPTVVTYVPHDKVAATMAKGGQIIGDHGLIVLRAAARRRRGRVARAHEPRVHHRRG
jgi:hypothetical protein